MNKPLAYRLRPTKFDDIIGQKRLVGEKGFFSSCLKNDSFVNVVLFGPPGCGKTTIANVIAKEMNATTYNINATNITKQQLLEVTTSASLYYPSIIIIDEIHQLDQTKQQILLPLLEEGKFFIIGTTTKNPLISLNIAIRSRVHILEMDLLTKEDIVQGLKKAIASKDGLDNKRTFTDDALEHIAMCSKGDMRYALNILEVCALNFFEDEVIDSIKVQEIKVLPNYQVDKNDSQYYDSVSALQKSIRGSDVNAALFYLAKLIRFNDLDAITRRLIVTAYEDVGLANPSCVDRTVNACKICSEIGFPEARIILAFAVIDLALSPKSASAEISIDKALEAVDNNIFEVRDYLKFTPINLTNNYPYGEYEILDHLIYLPEGLEDLKLYSGFREGKYEKALIENYLKILNKEKSSNVREILRKYKKQ